MNIKALFLTFLTGILAMSGVQAQILDDSTRNVYGPTTTRYIYENSIKYNQVKYHTIDTSLNDIHEFTLPQISKGRYKDLGNLGTALKPVYFKMPEQIGMTSGYDAYQYYFINPDQIRYFDSKSPYSKVKTFVAAKGRSITDVDLSRNINPQWNVAIRFAMLTADKQLAPKQARGDRHATSVAYNASVRHESKDKKYTMLAHFSRMSHKVNELGGIKVKEGDEDYFKYVQAALLLDGSSYPQNRDLTLNYHFYNQYKFNDLFQLYYSFDKRMQKIHFNDDNIVGDDKDFYGQTLVSESVTQDSSRFDIATHELGLKGDLNQLFYNFYYKRRSFGYYTDYLGKVNNNTENYGGTNIRYDFNPATHLGVSGEWLSGGNYKASAYFRYKIMNLAYSRALYEPSAMTQNYFGNHYKWSNEFNPVHADQLKADVLFQWPFLKVKPHVTFSVVNDPVFFNSEKAPEQANGNAVIMAPGLNFHLTLWKKWNLQADGIYAKVSGDAAEVFPVPELMANVKAYYESPVFNGALLGQFGLQAHYQSAYFSQGYDPVTMQYYLQDKFELPEYIAADAFVNGRIGSANIFIKWENFVQAFTGTGYFAAPYYSGQRSSFAFGVDWNFFD